MATRKADKTKRAEAIAAQKPKRKKKPENPEFKTERTLRQDLLHLRKLKRESTERVAAGKRAAEKAKLFESYVLERMDFEGVEAQKADHTNFIPTRTIFSNVTDRAAFIEWAEENEPDLIRTPEERSGELNTVVRRLIDDGENLPPGVSYYVKEYISTKAA